MLTIHVRSNEAWDEVNEEFLTQFEYKLELEHSLVSLSKWEQKTEKALLQGGEKTPDEILSYIEAMIIDPNFPPEVFSHLSQQNIDDINNYINLRATATWFPEEHGPSSREVVTSELIYFWMFQFQIPKECENWHLNKLFALIKVFNAKNQKPKKIPKADMLAERQRINEARRAKANSNG